MIFPLYIEDHKILSIYKGPTIDKNGQVCNGSVYVAITKGKNIYVLYENTEPCSIQNGIWLPLGGLVVCKTVKEYKKHLVKSCHMRKVL